MELGAVHYRRDGNQVYIADVMGVDDSRTYQAFSNDHINLEQADFPDIRPFLHMLWRSMGSLRHGPADWRAM